jgi:hypothetical protein
VYVSHTDPHSGWKKLIHFVCQFEALGSGISQIQKQFQNPKTQDSGTVFGFVIFHFQVPQTGTQSESTISGRAQRDAWTKKDVSLCVPV